MTEEPISAINVLFGGSVSETKPEVLYIHISNPGDICNVCYQGLGASNATAGVIKKFSERYPGLNIRITVEGGTVRSGVASILVRGGEIVE